MITLESSTICKDILVHSLSGIILTILVGFIISFIIAPVIINVLYKLKFRQHGKKEVDSLLQDRTYNIGTPVMGGFIIILPLIIFYIIAKIYLKLGWGPLFLIVTGAILGFLNDYYDLKGKNVKTWVYSKVNPIEYKNFKTWLIFKYLKAPFRLLDSLGSYTSGLPSSVKLLLQFIISVIALSMVSHIVPLNAVWIPFVGTFVIPRWLAYVFYGLVMVAFSNAFNVTDGLDAMSPGNHFISFLSLGILAWALGHINVAILAFFIAGTELTFYYFNVPPARVEMSDVGTLPLGLLFGLLLVFINRALVGPLLGFVFVIEIASSFIQSFFARYFKKKVFKMAPIHHHFEMLGWSKHKIVMRSYFVAIVTSLIGILIGLIG